MGVISLEVCLQGGGEISRADEEKIEKCGMQFLSRVFFRGGDGYTVTSSKEKRFGESGQGTARIVNEHIHSLVLSTLSPSLLKEIIFNTTKKFLWKDLKIGHHM